jgi:hypothetical protein
MRLSLDSSHWLVASGTVVASLSGATQTRSAWSLNCIANTLLQLAQLQTYHV